jgi:hypothetical protein
VNTYPASQPHARTADCAGHLNNRRPIGRGFIKHALAGLLLTAAVSLSAQTPTFTTLTSTSNLALTWDETAAASLHPDQVGTITLHFKNNTAQAIVLTDLAVNNSSGFGAIGPISIPASGTSDYALAVDGRTVGLPSNLSVFVKLQDGTASACAIPISSPDVILVSPRYVQWKVGDAVVAKTVQITNIPAGLAVTGVSSGSPAFTATLQGNTVTITPAGTATAVLAPITVLTEQPNSRPTLIAAQVATATN